MALKSKQPNTKSLARDIFDMLAQSVAILGGLISIVALILTLRAGTEQRASELRWSQAQLAAELIDGTLYDPLALNALNMIDWKNKEYHDGENIVAIDSILVLKALNVKNNKTLPPNGEFIRESFDRLSYHLGKIERSLQSELIVFKDVRSPMDYYIPFLRQKYGTVLIPYMEQQHHNDALEFMKRFPELEKPQPTRGS